MNTVETLIAVHLCKYKLTLSDILPYIIMDLYHKSRDSARWNDSRNSQILQEFQNISTTMESCNAIEGTTSNTNFRKQRLGYTDTRLRTYNNFINWKNSFERYIDTFKSLGIEVIPFEVSINRQLDYSEALILDEINSTKFGTILNIEYNY